MSTMDDSTSTSPTEQPVRTATPVDAHSQATEAGEAASTTAKKEAILDHVLRTLSSQPWCSSMNQDDRLSNLSVYFQLKDLFEEDKAGRKRILARDVTMENRLKAQVDMLKERLKGRETKMAEKDQRIEDLEQNKARLQNRVDELEKARPEEDQRNVSTSSVGEEAQLNGPREVKDFDKQQDSIDEATVPADGSSQSMSREELLSMLPEADRTRQEEYIDIFRAKVRDVIHCLPTGDGMRVTKDPQKERFLYSAPGRKSPVAEDAIEALWNVMRVEDSVKILGKEHQRHWDVVYRIPSCFC